MEPARLENGGPSFVATQIRPRLSSNTQSTESAGNASSAISRKRDKTVSRLAVTTGGRSATANAPPPSWPAIDRHLSLLPPVQAGIRAQPDAAVLRRNEGQNGIARQALLSGHPRDGDVAKAVDAIDRCHPDTPFTILEESWDRVAREPVGSGE